MRKKLFDPPFGWGWSSVVLLLLGSAWLMACRSEPPQTIYRAEYILRDHGARATNAEEVLETPAIEIAGDHRRLLYVDSGAVRFSEVPSPQGSRLLAGLAVDPDAWADTTGLGFRIRCLEVSGEQRTLFEHVLNPAEKSEDRSWHEVDQALEGCSVPTTQLELSNFCAEGQDCALERAGWGDPKVVYEQTFEPRTPRLALLISIDTLRPDRLSVYGNERPTSPRLEELARDGVVFETAVAPAPWTIPSHASMLTSTWPKVHGAGLRTGIPQRFPLLSEVLLEADWQTAAFVSIPYLGEQHGFDRGFEHFDPGEPPRGDYLNGVRMTRQRLLNWMIETDERPAFVFWHIIDVHGPYAARAPFGGRFRRELPTVEQDERFEDMTDLAYHDYLELDRFRSVEDLLATYDEAIAVVDDALGEFFDLLRSAGLYDDALIVITSDHGESFLDHGVWVGHGLFLTEDEIRVPLIAKLPGNVHAGTRVREMVRGIDVAPSMLDALGVEPPATFAGQSLLSPAPGHPDSLPDIAFGFSSGSGASYLRTGEVKYISPAEPGRIGHTLSPRPGIALDAEALAAERLFDLRRDPEESTPLDTVEMAEHVKALRQVMAEHARASEAGAGDDDLEPAELSPEALERLRALGYLN